MFNTNLHTLSAVQGSLLQEIDHQRVAASLASHVAAQLLTQQPHFLWQNSLQLTSPYAMHHHHPSTASASAIAYDSATHPATFVSDTCESDQGALEVSDFLQVTCLHSLGAWF